MSPIPTQIAAIIGNALEPGRPPRPKIADLSNDQILSARRILADCCRLAVPGFSFRPEYAQSFRDLTLWGLRIADAPLSPEKGLWIWGNIGTGKSTLLLALREFCRIVRPEGKLADPPCFPSWRITPSVDVAAAFQKEGYAGLETFISSKSQAFDDIGAETLRVNHFGTVVNVMEYIIMARYDRRHSQQTLLTSNINPSDITDLYGQRVFDRCREMFNFIHLPGASFRKSEPRQSNYNQI